MKHNLKRPCNDCPFRRKAAPGWLGSGKPEWFVSSALADTVTDDGNPDVYAAPCHQTVDYENPDWIDTVKDAEVCVGAVIFYRNVDAFKLPRQPERSELVASVEADHDVVFSTAEEFVNHHSNAIARSWERRE